MTLIRESRQLNRKSKIPLYFQLYEILRNAIVSGGWPPGTTVPPESELQSKYQVSQITVRQALDNLVKEGLIYRQRGRGTFVAQPAIETGLSRIISFTEDMQQRGYHPASQVIFSGLIEASARSADKLMVQPDNELAQINRLRFADDQPLSIEQSSLVHSLVPGILEVDYEANSLREIISDRYGIQLTRAKQSIKALNAEEEEARFLAITTGDALLQIERISYTQDDVPIELLTIYYRADRYVLFTDLQG